MGGADRARRVLDFQAMKTFGSRAAASLAVLASLSMTATPVLAHGYGDWHGHYHHHDGIDGGDLLAGLLIVGGVAAIASAVSKSGRDEPRDEPARYPGGPDNGEPDNQGYVEVPPAHGNGASDYPGGPARTGDSFDAAVDTCTSEIERGEHRVDTVDNVRRMGDRYSVEGRLEDGHDYACSVDDTGQIRSVAIDGRGVI